MASPKTPSTNSPEFEVPIQLFEEALGRIFEPAHLQNLKLDLSDCERLYHALYNYHRNNRIQPVKSIDTVRPNLCFASETSGVIVEKDCLPYVAGSFIPRNSALFIPEDDIKRTLLFADAVVIEDPVFGFCRAVLCHNYMESRPPFSVLEEDLRKLAEFRPLLEKRLLRITAYFPEPVLNFGADVPRNQGSMRVRDVATASDYRDQRVFRLIAGHAPDRAKVGADAWRQFADQVIDNNKDDFRSLYRQAESLVYGADDPDAYCPHFPNSYQLSVFRKLVARGLPKANLNLKVTMELNSGCATDPSKIGIPDLVTIRRDEQVFEQWRELVRQSVVEAQARQSQDETIGEIFRSEIENRARHWKSLFEKFNKGTLKNTMTASKEISVGGFASALSGSVAAIGGLFHGIFKSAAGLSKSADRNAAEKAAYSFFTVIQETKPV